MRKTIVAVLPLLLFAGVLWADNLSTEQLLENLKASDPKTRVKAAEELGERGEKLGVSALLQATSDPDPKVQLEAVKALGKINHPEMVSTLSQAARNSSGAAQKEALKLLTGVYIPSKDHNALVELWKTIERVFNPPHPRVVEPWIKVDAEAVDSVVFVLDQKTSENRIDAAATLGILRAESALPRLRYYLRSPNPRMVRTCIRSIGYIAAPQAGEDLLPLLKHEDRDVAADATRVLGQLRYRPALAEIQRSFELSTNDEFRRVALQAISRMADPSSEPLLRKYLDDEDKFLRQYAIEAFGRMNNESYKHALQLAFQRENSRQLKLALGFSLFSLGESAYIDTLVQSMDDRLYRDQVREYLVELGPKAVPSLAAYLKGSEKETALQIIRTLGDMHQPSAIQYLEPYMKAQDIDVAQAATDAIRELKKMEAVAQAGVAMTN